MRHGREFECDPRSRKRAKIYVWADHHWAIILAGGEGERMRLAVTSWLGSHRPKQYCTFVGTRSMLRHTWDRARRLVDQERVLTFIDRTHRRFLELKGHREIPGRVK